EGAQAFTALMQELRPDAPPLNYYNEGYVEAQIVHEALLAAYDSGDMTRAGILAAAKTLDNVEFEGLAHPETYVGEPNDMVQRRSFIYKPDLEAPTGSVLVERDYMAPIVEDFVFEGACYELEGSKTTPEVVGGSSAHHSRSVHRIVPSRRGQGRDH